MGVLPEEFNGQESFNSLGLVINESALMWIGIHRAVGDWMFYSFREAL